MSEQWVTSVRSRGMDRVPSWPVLPGLSSAQASNPMLQVRNSRTADFVVMKMIDMICYRPPISSESRRVPSHSFSSTCVPS